MGLVFGDNISYQGKKPLDARSLFNTLAEMKAYSENYLPDLAICQNKEDGKLYVYNSTNTVDATTGKWRVFTSGSTISKLEDIGDVTLTSIKKDQALLWDGAKWINGDVTTGGGGSAGGNTISQVIDIQKVNVKAGPSSVHPLTLYTYTNNTNHDVYISFNGIASTDTGSNQGFLSMELDNVQFDKLILTTGTNMDLIFTTKMTPGQVLTIKGDWTGTHSNCNWAVVGNLAVYAEAPMDLYYSIDRYGEDEICIGEYAGKPVYRKVISIPSGASASGTVNPVGDYSWVEHFIRADVLADSTNSVGSVYCRSEGTIGLKLWCAEGAGSGRILIIEYTKTADAPNSFKPSMVTDNILLNVAPSYDDYSTDEIIVGKWTNGKPVYRKTFIATSPTATSKEDLLTGIDLDMDDEVRLYGFVDLGIRRLPLNYYYNDAYNMACYYHKSNKRFILHISHADYANKPVVITIEYTKASDAANSFTPDMIKTIPMNDEVTTAQVDEVLDVLKGGK